MQMNLKVTAHSMDFDLVKRYLELNPYKHLMVSDPQRYDNDRMIYESHEEKISFCTSRLMESNGILLQLFSRFVTEESVRKVTANTLYGKLDLAVQYVNKNLDKHISIIELADLMFITPDHFLKSLRK